MKFVWPLAMSLLLFILFAPATAEAQGKAISLDNPSFEDMPRHSMTPRYWSNCGSPDESPPDIQPELTFQVSKPAYAGATYLGMVVRDNDTWEAVGQLLSEPLQLGDCYSFSIKLARSLSYYSVSREKNVPANYIKPVKLRIWGGFGTCDKRELLDESPLVSNPDWKEFEFKFEPGASYTHIVLEAFYQTPSLFPYNGNLLLDDASMIEPLPCSQEIAEGPQDPEPTNQPLASVTPRSPDPVVTRVVTEPKNTPTNNQEASSTSLAGVKRSEMTAGKTITLDDIQFEADSSRIIPASLPALEELRNFLANNSDVIIEVGGHTNGWADARYAETLSTARAKSVADYLVRKGIPRSRVRYKGYGKEVPIDTNETAAGRKRNQRVEIKILDVR
ncbi:OmpA family protein [Lewinella sp. LCG006]|uniref:OmpA family protein n=1 Tax=Lewinella sp. LCG006 TaxID=3231911 RepID=UPI003460B329